MDQDQYSDSLYSLTNWMVVHASGILSLFSLFSSSLMVFSLLMGAYPAAVLVFFYITVDLYHLVNALLMIFPHFEVEGNVWQRAAMCPNIHKMIISLFILGSGSSNLLYAIDYLVISFIDSLSYILNVIIVSYKINSPIIGVLKQLSTNTAINTASPIIELLEACYLVMRAFSKMNFLLFVVCAAYIFFVNIAGLVTIGTHAKMWSSIGLFLREFAAKRNDGLGRLIESACDKGELFTKKVKKIFPTREVKVHLQ